MNARAARLLTQTLAGVCGVLALCAVVLYAGFGRGYGWLPDEGEENPRPQVGAVDNKPVQLPPASSFAAIDAHPLFNEDRQPTPVDASASGVEEAPPPSPLNVALTGVILDAARDVHIAMVQDRARNQAIALRVGMPLEGEQASWTLVEVKPRAAVFRSAANETTEIELETSVAQAAPAKPSPGRPQAPGKPGAPVPPPAGAKGPAPNAVPSPANDASADLARRIEERRRQMREDAERQRNGGQPAPQNK